MFLVMSTGFYSVIKPSRTPWDLPGDRPLIAPPRVPSLFPVKKTFSLSGSEKLQNQNKPKEVEQDKTMTVYLKNKIKDL